MSVATIACDIIVATNQSGLTHGIREYMATTIQMDKEMVTAYKK
jgi:hypothetical protein